MKLRYAYLALAVLFSALGIAHATNFPTLNQAVAVCDPNFPTNCLAPTGGGLPISLTSTTNTPVAPAAPTATNANLVACQFVTAGVTFTNLQQGALSCDANGDLLVNATGNVASAATDAGNPVKVGSIFLSAPPAFTNGQRADLQSDSRGSLKISIMGPSSTNAVAVNTTADALANTIALNENAFNLIYNGTTWDRTKGIAAAVAAGTGTQAVAIAPTSAAGGGITPVVTSAAAATLVLKASAGNLYQVYAANVTATAGFLVVLNATSAPADGAITPLACAALPANGNATISFQPGPASVYSTGITAVVTSAATCFTKTTGVITAFISGSVQ